MTLQNIKIIYDEINWFSKKRGRGLPFEPVTALNNLFKTMPDEIIRPDHTSGVSMKLSDLKEEFERYQEAHKEGLAYKQSEQMWHIERMVREALKPPEKEAARGANPAYVKGSGGAPESYNMALPMKCLCVNITRKSFYDKLPPDKKSFAVTKFMALGGYAGASSLVKFSFNWQNRVIYVLEEKTPAGGYRSFHFAHDFDQEAAFNFIYLYREALKKERYDIIRSMVKSEGRA